jgi:hypothetical protein
MRRRGRGARRRAAGLARGRPHLEDLAIGRDGVTLLDFEEDPLKVTPVADA